MKFFATLFALCLFAPSPTLAAPGSNALRGVVICLDPGHTSETSAGTMSRDHRLSERHVNWIVAVRLRQLLQDEGATVVMTKPSEEQIVTNRRRAEIANAAHALLLLRLHCDSGPHSGFATYYPDRQGRTQGVTGPTREVLALSHGAALVFHPAAVAALKGALKNTGIRPESGSFVGGRQGALTGSIFARVPALTVEMCVLTNAHDYAFIRSGQGQEQMARALLDGIAAYARIAKRTQ